MTKSKQIQSRKILGRISRATQGGVYGSIETAGLRNAAIQL
jgi:hypothetical protein